MDLVVGQSLYGEDVGFLEARGSVSTELDMDG